MPEQDFLLEIGTEEIPVGYLPGALAQLAEGLEAWLAEQRLAQRGIQRFATARRLALLVEGLQLRQEDRDEEVTGPPEAAAFKDGEPTKAALGFARGQGGAPEDLYVVDTPKGRYVALRRQLRGREAAELLAEQLPALVTGLRWPKTMLWGDGALRFPRPIRWIVALLGDAVLPLRLGALEAGRESRGRRQSGVERVDIPRAADYAAHLRQIGVEPDPLRRREALLGAARRAAAAEGGRLVEDDELADTVNYLSEWPVALVGGFAEASLALPREVVTTAMKSHQRYFSVEGADGALLPRFVVILNGERPEPDVVRKGNERVLAARLADARFYWDEDCRAGLEGLRARLESVLWMEGYGSLAERCERLRVLAAAIAKQLPADGPALDADALDWAARYCKADQASEMIKDGKEFTKLSGLMGREYALAEGVAPARAALLHEHCLPRFAGDRLPATREGAVLALADRLDALVGFWSAGFAPTGSKDPYALRRQALGTLRLLVETELPLCLADLLDAAIAGFPQLRAGELRPALMDFMLGRFRGLLEEEGVAADIFDAVVESGETRVLDLRGRALALNGLRGDAAFEQLVIGARRVGNILAKAEIAPSADRAFPDLERWARGGAGLPYDYDPAALVEAPERELHAEVAAATAALHAAAQVRDYGSAYRRLADLGGAIDAYFEGVMVNAEDPGLRANRLAFLRNLAQIFLHFASFSRVVLEGEREGTAPVR